MSAPKELILLPGEDTDAAKRRRIMQHEFLMTGGVVTGRDERGDMTYSGPVTVIDYPVCPWHEDENCAAWNAIVAGDGYWTAMERELAELQEYVTTEGAESPERVAELALKLAERPRDAHQLRSRTPEQIAQEAYAAKHEREEAKRASARRKAEFEASARAAAKVAAAAAHGPLAGLRGEDGNIDAATVLCRDHNGDEYQRQAFGAAQIDTDFTKWHKVPRSRYECIICKIEQPVVEPVAKSASTDWMDKQPPVYKPISGSMYRPMKPEPIMDSRDDAVSAFAFTDTPDAIEIDGDEGEETA